MVLKEKDFDIDFVGLKLGAHNFTFILNQSFFDLFNYEEVKNFSGKVDLEFNKKSTNFELTFKFEATHEVICDVSNEIFIQNLEDELFVYVKFGAEYNEDSEDLLIIPHGEYRINVAQLIYEMILLSFPIKNVHPEVENGTMESEVLDKLEELATLEEIEEIEEEETDQRWSALKNFKIEK